MKIETLKDLYAFGIEDMNDGCGKAYAAMEEMRDAATHPDLRRFMVGAVEAMDHSLAIFDRILTRLGIEPSHPQNLALAALGQEGLTWVVETDYSDPDLRDLAIVEKARNVAHYPQAGFTAFIAQARALRYEEDAAALGSTSASPSGADNATAFAAMDSIEADLLSRVGAAQTA